MMSTAARVSFNMLQCLHVARKRKLLNVNFRFIYQKLIISKKEKKKILLLAKLIQAQKCVSFVVKLSRKKKN